jgi:hypothetical protein
MATAIKNYVMRPLVSRSRYSKLRYIGFFSRNQEALCPNILQNSRGSGFTVESKIVCCADEKENLGLFSLEF